MDPSLRVPLCASEIQRDARWVDWVNRPATAAEEEAIRRCLREGRPFGGDRWLSRTKARLGWREPGKPGRPRKSGR